MAADHAGEAVQGQHGTLAGAAAGDDIIGCAAVQQDGSQNAALHIGQLGSIVGSVHAVVDHLVAHGFHYLFQGSFNDAVLGGLTVLVDECNFHRFMILLLIFLPCRCRCYTKSSRMGVKKSSITPPSRHTQPCITPSCLSRVSPGPTSRVSSPMVKR